MRVERFERDAADPERWVLTTLETPGAVLELAAIGCAVSLRDIYQRVALPPAGHPAKS